MGGGVGEDLSLNMDFFTDKTRPNYTSQPFTLHCNKKSIPVAGDHHGSRQNIRLVRTRFSSLLSKEKGKVLLASSQGEREGFTSFFQGRKERLYSFFQGRKHWFYLILSNGEMNGVTCLIQEKKERFTRFLLTMK